MLAQLPSLQNLTLKACPVAEQQSYQDSVIRLLPQLQVLDSHKVSNAATQARQQEQSSSAKQPSAQRPALQAHEKRPLSNSIDRMGRAQQPAMKKATQAHDKTAVSIGRQQQVSSGSDEAAVLASRPVFKRKQREQPDESGTANAKAGHGVSHVSSGAHEGKRARQATSTGQGIATDRQADSVSAVAGEPGKKQPCRDITAAADAVQSQKDSIRKERRTQHTLTMGKTSGLGVKALKQHTATAVDAAKIKPSKKLTGQKGKASAPVLGMPQAQASRKAQSASQALATGKEVGLPGTRSHQECDKVSLG